MHSFFCLLGYCFAKFLGHRLLYDFHLLRLNIGNYSWRHWDTAGIYWRKGCERAGVTLRPKSQQAWQQSSKASINVTRCYFLLLFWLTEKAASEMLKVKSKVRFREEILQRKQRPRCPEGAEKKQIGGPGTSPADFSLHWQIPWQWGGSTDIDSSPAFHLWDKLSLTSWKTLLERFLVPLNTHC